MTILLYLLGFSAFVGTLIMLDSWIAQRRSVLWTLENMNSHIKGIRAELEVLNAVSKSLEKPYAKKTEYKGMIEGDVAFESPPVEPKQDLKQTW